MEYRFNTLCKPSTINHQIIEMNKLIITLVLMISILVSCTQKNTEEADAFVAFAEHFSETESFALADVSGHEVLLVSQETFGNNMNSDKEAIEATIFALDKKGKIVSLGSIRSQGTLYPVSILDGKIMVAGHQFVRIYSIRENEAPELVLDNYSNGEGPEVEELFRTFEKGTPVKFSKTLLK